MTTSRKASQRPAPQKSRRPRIALALAGGGPLGAIYEIGALCALDDTLPGLDLNDCEHYVGVSAGGFIAAGLANGIRPRQLCEAFIEDRPGDDNFDPSWLLKPAWGEFGDRLQRLPRPPVCSTTRASTSRFSACSASRAAATTSASCARA